MSALIEEGGERSYPRDGTRAFHEIKANAQQISRREWFVTNAPEVPDWFRYQAEGKPTEEKRALPDRLLELNTEQHKELLEWEAGQQPDFHSLTKPVQEFMLRSQRIEAVNKRFHEWHMKSREAKWWAWREYFADIMMEQKP